MILCLSGRPSGKFVALAAGFAAGVMICVSIFDLILPECLKGSSNALMALLATLAGSAITRALSRLPCPSPEDFAAERFGLTSASYGKDKGLLLPGSSPSPSRSPAAAAAALSTVQQFRSGLLLAGILACHNLPEGLAVALSTEQDLRLGVQMSIAIFIHNTAEGASTALPLYASTGSAPLALAITALSGATEPLGALIGMAAVTRFDRSGATGGSSSLLESLISLSLCAVGGCMMQISADELLPAARAGASTRAVVAAVAAGFVVIGATMAAT